MNGATQTHDARFLIIGVIFFLFAIAAVTLLAPNRKQKMRLRLASFSPQEEIVAATVRSTTTRPLDIIGGWLARSPLVGATERAKIMIQLGGAGITAKDSVSIFIAAKFGAALFTGLIVWALLTRFHVLTSSTLLRFGAEIGGAWIGWRVPDTFVSKMASGRRRKLREGIADALDLLVICVESGLGLEQGLDRVSRDIAVANPVVAGELRTTVSEMKVLPQMRDALDNLAKRTGMPLIKSIVTTFVQSLQYGTPLAQALRVLAAEMRAHRLLEIEERAAQLPVWMTLPLILFILPCLFLVVGGPAVIQVMDVMGHR